MKKAILLSVFVAGFVLLAEKWIARYFVSPHNAVNRLYSTFDRNKNQLYRLLLFFAVEVLAMAILYLLLKKYTRCKSAMALGLTVISWLVIVVARQWIF